MNEFFSQEFLSLIKKEDLSDVLMDALETIENNSLTIDTIDLHYMLCIDEIKIVLDNYKDALIIENENMLDLVREVSSANKILIH